MSLSSSGRSGAFSCALLLRCRRVRLRHTSDAGAKSKKKGYKAPAFSSKLDAKVRGSIKQIYVEGAEPGTRLLLVNPNRRVYGKGRAERFRQQDLPRGPGKVRLPRAEPPGRWIRGQPQGALAEARRQPAPVLLPQHAPAPGGSQLREDARRRRDRNDGSTAARHGHRRRTVPDRHRALGLRYRRSRRPGHDSVRRDRRASHPRRRNDRRFGHRPASRLRLGQHADARIGLLRRRLRPVRPADHV